MKCRWWVWALVALTGLVLAALIVFVVWAQTPLGPMPEAVDGLVLWAAYPPSGDDLSGWVGLVASVSATNDGLTTPEDIAQTTPLLPAGTVFVTIDGGNHAQFGWYGKQRGDGVATISREDQQSQTVAATLSLLRTLATTVD